MSVTAAAGFRAAGVAGGLKSSGDPDVALVVNDGPTFAAAGVFTANRVQAAPVLWSRQVLSGGSVRAVLANSGGANACTGAPGFQDAHVCAETTAQLLAVSASEVALCSTGLIGVRLPLEHLLPAIAAAAAALAPDAAAGAAASAAILTTDTRPKTSVRTRSAGGAAVTVGGMAKGAGMLAPALATMLVVITTDAVADAAQLARVLGPAAEQTFARVDSDGCLSTNDTVLLLASGASGVALGDAELAGLLEPVCAELAAGLIGDAEGASKEVAITVAGAADEADAVTVARAIARSNLLKCALHGEDPNWGRVLAAVGTTSARFEPDQLDVDINGVGVARGCAPAADRSRVDLSARSVTIRVDLHAGDATATVWTNDLTADYVHENSAYST